MSYFTIDPAHLRVDIFGQDITRDVWRDKYRWGNEKSPEESMRRVAEGVYAKDDNEEELAKAIEAMQLGLWVPGGRIHAGAGTPKIVTLINCYVCQTIDDSMEGIANALKDAMLTQQQGGGIGMDFCVVPGTKVLTYEGDWKNVEDIQVGESLVGFDEHASHRMMRKAVVEATKVLQRPC